MLSMGVVTLSFNQVGYLSQAIESVSVGDPRRLRYVIVDPGSTDGSREIIKKYAGRFHATCLEADRGPADGLNKGFGLCGGDILGYLNSDDRFVAGALDFALAYFANNPDIDVLLGSIRIVDGSGRISIRCRPVERFDPALHVAGACNVWQQATFFRRKAFEAVGGFNVDNPISWDSELVVDLMLKGCRLGYTHLALGDFRQYEESLTGSSRLRREHLDARRRIRGKLEQSGSKVYRPTTEAILRMCYKYSLARHIRCLMRPEVPGGLV